MLELQYWCWRCKVGARLRSSSIGAQDPKHCMDDKSTYPRMIDSEKQSTKISQGKHKEDCYT